MEKKLSLLLDEIKKSLEKAINVKEIDDIWISIFGQSGVFTRIIKEIQNIPKEKRPEAGKLTNQVKYNLEELFIKKRQDFSHKELENGIDVTIPGNIPKKGHLHIVTQAIFEITNIFEKIGFTKVSYPEIEWEHYAFEALNMPKDHPARDDFETFFINQPAEPKFGKMVLTPHTSSGQVREMLKVGKPPIRMINIGKCYRPNWDISHTPMFYQFEGLVIDEGINITHLKGTMDYFAKEFFGPERKTRLRPFHFQFTEPSFEVDITCGVCLGKGTLEDGKKCRICKEGWLELGGSGMVHPNVLHSGNIDSNKYTGFAFGWGIERTYMMKSGTKLDDIRLLYGNDMRFLEQF